MLIAFPEHLFLYSDQVTFLLHTLNNCLVVESPITFAVQGCVLVVFSRNLMASKSYIQVLLLHGNDFSIQACFTQTETGPPFKISYTPFTPTKHV